MRIHERICDRLAGMFHVGDLVRFGSHDRLLVYVGRTVIGFEKLRPNRFKGNLALYGIYELARCRLVKPADRLSIRAAGRINRKYRKLTNASNHPQ